MTPLRFTLISDGSSDRILLKPLRWLLLDLGIQHPLEDNWADLRRLPEPPRTLRDKITTGLHLHPCDLLFVHRDAEKAPTEKRRQEIETAMQAASASRPFPPIICVIPVRMQEAWFLFDEISLRSAVGNPHGRARLDLPRLAEIEELPDPKGLLHEAMKTASELSTRRRKNFPVSAHIHRLADLIESYEPLLQLSAFRTLRKDLEESLHQHGWLRSQ
jgi:hypothetical protein